MQVKEYKCCVCVIWSASAVYVRLISLSVFEAFREIVGRIFVVYCNPQIPLFPSFSSQAAAKEMDTGSLRGKHTKKTAIYGA